MHAQAHVALTLALGPAVELVRVELARDGVRREDGRDGVGVGVGRDRAVRSAVALHVEQRRVRIECIGRGEMQFARFEEAAALLTVRDLHRAVKDVELVPEAVGFAIDGAARLLPRGSIAVLVRIVHSDLLLVLVPRATAGDVEPSNLLRLLVVREQDGAL